MWGLSHTASLGPTPAASPTLLHQTFSQMACGFPPPSGPAAALDTTCTCIKATFLRAGGSCTQEFGETGTTLVKFITIPPHCERGWKCKTKKESPHCALTQSRLPYGVAEGQKQCGKQCVECAAFSAKIGKRGNLCNICSTGQRIPLEGHAEMCDISCYREEGDPSPGALPSSWHLSG